MTGKLFVVGVGPGGPALLLPAALQIIETSDLLIGGVRNLSSFRYLGKATLEIHTNLEEICQYIDVHYLKQKITVLASGDPGIFSILRMLRRALPRVELDVTPGISSLQYLSSKLALPWDDWRLVSLHGRAKNDLAMEVCNHRRVCVFTGGQYPPEVLCRQLNNAGWGELSATVGENLASSEERIVTGTVELLSGQHFAGPALLLIESKEQPAKIWPYVTPGLPDEMFTRGAVPMTKEEVRAVVLAKLRLTENSIVYDIGAGTGSVSLECALVCPHGRIYAIEHNSEAIRLITENCQRFGRVNLEVIAGSAPEVLGQLPQSPDRVFIGGTGGQLEAIIGWLGKLTTRPRVVLTSVTLETTGEAVQLFKQHGFTAVELVNIAVSRYEKTGNKHLIKALNPITIISAE